MGRPAVRAGSVGPGQPHPVSTPPVGLLAETRRPIQYLVTTSTIAYATRLHLVKWVTSQIQIRFFSQAISGNAGFPGHRRTVRRAAAHGSSAPPPAPWRGTRTPRRCSCPRCASLRSNDPPDPTSRSDRGRLLLPGQRPVDRAATRPAVRSCPSAVAPASDALDCQPDPAPGTPARAPSPPPPRRRSAPTARSPNSSSLTSALTRAGTGPKSPSVAFPGAR